jgi:hypothetical protein
MDLVNNGNAWEQWPLSARLAARSADTAAEDDPGLLETCAAPLAKRQARRKGTIPRLKTLRMIPILNPNQHLADSKKAGAEAPAVIRNVNPLEIELQSELELPCPLRA